MKEKAERTFAAMRDSINDHKSVRGLKASVGRLAGRTASAARGLGASASGIFKRLTTDPRFAQEKLIPANMTQENADEGAALQNYMYNESGDIIDSSGDSGKKLGQFYQHQDGKYYPYFLRDEYNPKMSWNIARMDPLSKKYRF
jgi:hypothetical protein